MSIAIRHTRMTRLPLRSYPLSERPRERLLDAGVTSLSDTELLSLLLGSGTRDIGSVATLAFTVLQSSINLTTLSRTEPNELMQLPGIGPARAAAICAAFELGRRAHGQRRPNTAPITNSQQVADTIAHKFIGARQEVFLVVLLDARHRIRSIVQVAQGSLTHVEVHPREVFSAAVRASAAAIIVAHNHPSGDPEPSHEDTCLTQRLKSAGDVLGIPLLDHIVIADQGYVSFADRQLV